MAVLTWDQTGERVYETGVDRGVLYIPNNAGAYVNGYAWNGLTAVTESPSGAESNKQYADNRVYANLLSAEEFGATVEAFTYPVEFEQCDGTALPTPGVGIGQQTRKSFGLAYRTLVGNDTEGTEHGYKLHLVYGATAAPSEKARTTVNDSPEAMTFSWELTTDPVEVGTIAGVTYKPTSTLTIDSTQVDAGALATLEEFLYGTAGTEPSLPSPAAVVAMFSGTVVSVTPTQPTYDGATNTMTVPSVTGVTYYMDDEALVAGPVVLTENKIVTARPNVGYKFPANVDSDWLMGDF
ncbi:major tail protein [Streptomyces phage RosaAsantewaa]|nr:major tail protein [Streptomyces phage RosaAsantewaa]